MLSLLALTLELSMGREWRVGERWVVRAAEELEGNVSRTGRVAKRACLSWPG